MYKLFIILFSNKRIHPFLWMAFQITVSTQSHPAAVTEYLAHKQWRLSRVTVVSRKETLHRLKSAHTDRVYLGVQHHSPGTATTWKHGKQTCFISNSQTQGCKISACRNEELHASHKRPLPRTASGKGERLLSCVCSAQGA